MKLFSIATVAALVFAPVSAIAQNAPSGDDSGKKSYMTGDANRVICRTADKTGSRLNRGRICMTASEWAESKRETRRTIEQAQTQRPSRDN